MLKILKLTLNDPFISMARNKLECGRHQKLFLMTAINDGAYPAKDKRAFT